MLPSALASLLAATAFLGVVPPEPDAIVLLEGSIQQVVAADLDGDGARELLLLAGGNPDASVTVEAWTEASAGGWRRIGDRVVVVPAAAPATPDASAGPVRLLVRQVEGDDRVTLLRQGALEAAACCLTLHDIVLASGELRLAPVSVAAPSVDAAWVLDLDGDGTDELVASRSIQPLGDTSYPIETFMHRWTGIAFEVTQARLPAGSGDTPFLLGDTDGRPGEELGIIATLGRPELHRISFHQDATLGMEDAGVVAQDATAVPIGDGRGIAVLTGAGTLGIHAWPFGEDLQPPVAQRILGDGRLVGTVVVDDVPRLVVRQSGAADRLHVLGLPELARSAGSVTRTPAAAALASGPLRPFEGVIPGGDGEGGSAIVYGGRLLSNVERVDQRVPIVAEPIASLAGAYPIGVVGRGHASIALLRPADPGSVMLPDPSGGRLDPPVAHPASVLSVAPLGLVLEPELDGGLLEPPTDGAVPLDGRGEIAVDAGGFMVRLTAPPGSRVHVAGGDPSVAVAVLAVPEDGSLVVPMPPPAVSTPDPRYRATLVVSTPAGRGYVATWEVRVLAEPPPLRTEVRTAFGSGDVEVTGETLPLASVTINGQPVSVDAAGRFTALVPAPPFPTEIAVVAVDPVGNRATRAVVAIGWFDYRQLPWIPIALTLVGATALFLSLRVPRTRPEPRRADDDAILEELDPD